MAVRTLAHLAHLAEVPAPFPRSGAAQFLRDIAKDVDQRLSELGSELHADEVHSVAEMALPLDQASLWAAWQGLGLWAEPVDALPASASMTTRAEAALTAVGVRLTAALVARSLASEEFAA